MTNRGAPSAAGAQNPLRISSGPHPHGQSSAEITETESSDAEVSSNCSTTDTVPQDGEVSTRALNLDFAVPELPPLGSQERPSVGSTCHHLGLCKPCAHAFSKDGCHNGFLCNFCHLCGPEEVKRRKKQKQAFQRAMRRCAPAHA